MPRCVWTLRTLKQWGGSFSARPTGQLSDWFSFMLACRKVIGSGFRSRQSFITVAEQEDAVALNSRCREPSDRLATWMSAHNARPFSISNSGRGGANPSGGAYLTANGVYHAMRILLFFSDTKTTRFMQSAGVFEKSKFLVAEPLEATAKDDFGMKDAETLAEKSKAEPYRLIACVGEGFRYIDPDVRLVSTGTQWAPVEDYLNMFG